MPTQFNITEHAKKRAVSRLGVPAEEATDYLTSLMSTAIAFDSGTNMENIEYIHQETKTVLIVDPKTNNVVTVYPLTKLIRNKRKVEELLFQIEDETLVSAIKPILQKRLSELEEEIITIYEDMSRITYELAQLRASICREMQPDKKEALVQEMQSKNDYFKQIKQQRTQKQQQYGQLIDQSYVLIGQESINRIKLITG